MLKNFRYPILLLLIFFSASALHAALLKTLSLDFTREVIENDTTEQIAGRLHYDVKTERVVIEVNRPIKQVMVAKGNILEIYYPEKRQAFRFISKGPVPLPLVETIIQTTQAEYGLTTILGYTLEKHEIVDKVLYTHWKPPEASKEKLGVVILGIRDDRLISAEVKDPKGFLVAKTLYQHHSKIGIHYIPMTVTSSTYGEKSEVLRYEKILYSDPEANADPQNPILNFTIPESVEVQEIQW